MNVRLAAVATCASFSMGARATVYLMIPSARSTNNARLMTFDPYDGHVVHSSYINLQGMPPSIVDTPIEAKRVNNEIWLTDQVTNRINRFTLSGASLGSLSGSNFQSPMGLEY